MYIYLYNNIYIILYIIYTYIIYIYIIYICICIYIKLIGRWYTPSKKAQLVELIYQVWKVK